MFISLQLLTSLQFQVYFVCWRILKIVCWTSTSDFGPNTFLWPINLDLTYGVIVLSIIERTTFSTTIRIITMILISSDANYTSLKISLARLHWAVHDFFFKGNLAGASSFSNFWKQGHTTTPGKAFPPFCEKCEDSLRSLLTSTEKMQEMGPAVYRSVPRRLKLLTVWVFTAHSPQSFQDHERWSGPRPEPSTSRTAVQRPTT